MKRLYYMVYKTYKGEVFFLKDPETCNGKETPFNAYIKSNPDAVVALCRQKRSEPEAFLPWMTSKKTALALATLLDAAGGGKHYVGAVEIDFSLLIDIQGG